MAYDFPNAPTVGQAYNNFLWDGEKWIQTLAAPNSAGVIAIKVFTVSGTYIPSVAMTTCVIECQGGGGGGGGVGGGATTNAYPSAGGGSGGYSRKIASAADIGASKPVTIGAGGSVGNGVAGAGGKAGDGGQTSVGTLCIANGGIGGIGTVSSAAGGAGGAAGTGDLALPGSTAPSVAGFVGVGTADPILLGGNGAATRFGAGGSGSIAYNSVASGNPGMGYGSGGGGGATHKATASAVGSVGAAGIVIITEYGITLMGSGSGGGGSIAGAVRYDIAQGLSTPQMVQGRANIDAASTTSVTSGDALKVTKAGDTMSGALVVVGGASMPTSVTPPAVIARTVCATNEVAWNAYPDGGFNWRTPNAGYSIVSAFTPGNGIVTWYGGNNVAAGGAVTITPVATFDSTGVWYAKAYNVYGSSGFGLYTDAGLNRFAQVATGSAMYYGNADAHMYFSSNSDLVLRMQSDGNMLMLSGNQPYKPGGGPWLDNSDARIKNVEGDYPRGLAEIVQLQPVIYTFKGNDTLEAPLNQVDGKLTKEGPAPAVPYANSMHVTEATTVKQFVGLIAQEAEIVMPELVTQTAGFIDGEAVTDLRSLDAGPLIFALINAVKELKARIEVLEAG